MPLDMPPQAPAYHIERAAPVAASVFDTIIAISHRTSPQGEASSVNRMLPEVDSKSQALSDEDRNAILDGMTANWNDELAQSKFALPKSYVGERVALGLDYARMRSDPGAGAEDTRSMRCRIIAVALDKRAGAYVVGGEAAASAARNSIPAEAIAACASSIKSAQARGVPIANPVQGQFAGRADPSKTSSMRVDLVQSSRGSTVAAPEPRVSFGLNPAALRLAQSPGRGD